MKKIGVLAAVLAMACLCVGVAQAEMYVEGYIGGTQAQNIGQSFSVHDFSPIPGHAADFNHHLSYAGTVDLSVLGGVKMGTWFVKEGTLGWSGYPEWAKYLGFYTDFSYQRLYMRDQRISGTETNVNNGGNRVFTDIGFIQSNGMAATWAFMFAGRYGFFPDSDVPFGRLQPYVAVGPAIMWSSMKPKMLATAVTFSNPDLGFSGNNASSTNIALAVDTGIRYMMLKNVSADISFKWRYAQPSYHVNGIDNGAGFNIPANSTLNPTYSLFSVQAGVAYHF